MKWTEPKYFPGLPILPSFLIFNFDNMHPRNEDYVSNQELSWTELSQLKLNYCYDAILSLEL